MHSSHKFGKGGHLYSVTTIFTRRGPLRDSVKCNVMVISIVAKFAKAYILGLSPVESSFSGQNWHSSHQSGSPCTSPHLNTYSHMTRWPPHDKWQNDIWTDIQWSGYTMQSLSLTALHLPWKTNVYWVYVSASFILLYRQCISRLHLCYSMSLLCRWGLWFRATIKPQLTVIVCLLVVMSFSAQC